MNDRARSDSALPDFLVLGAAKCGTTSLYAYLQPHPELFLSALKEPIFFEAEYERGLDYYRRHYFSGYAGQRAVGEARTHNLLLPYVAPRIRESLPEARLIALVRDPIDRAYSHWWHRHSRALEPRSFEDALAENLRRIESGLRFEGVEGERLWRKSLIGRPPGTATRYGLYLDLGYYAEQLERYRGLFPPERLKVLFFDDLSRDPQAVTRQVWEFLGLDPGHTAADGDARNPAFERQWSPLAARLRRFPRPDLVARVLPGPLRRRVARYLAGRPANRPALAAETEDSLLAHFEPHNRRLEALTGRALPGWFERSETRTRAPDARDA